MQAFSNTIDRTIMQHLTRLLPSRTEKFHTQTYTRHPDWLSRASQHPRWRLKTRRLCTRVDLQTTPAGCTLDNLVTFTFDFVTSGPTACRAPAMCRCLSTLVLIAQALFLLERGRTQTGRPTHRQSNRQNWSPYVRLGDTAGICPMHLEAAQPCT